MEAVSCIRSDVFGMVDAESRFSWLFFYPRVAPGSQGLLCYYMSDLFLCCIYPTLNESSHKHSHTPNPMQCHRRTFLELQATACHGALYSSYVRRHYFSKRQGVCHATLQSFGSDKARCPLKLGSNSATPYAKSVFAVDGFFPKQLH
jgi:hypothetical protein